LDAALFVACLCIVSLGLIVSPAKVYWLMGRLFLFLAERWLNVEYVREMREELKLLEIDSQTFADTYGKTLTIYRLAGVVMLAVAVFAAVQFVQ
jgi:hypothetical protein